jgi:hypothetical protein
VGKGREREHDGQREPERPDRRGRPGYGAETAGQVEGDPSGEPARRAVPRACGLGGRAANLAASRRPAMTACRCATGRCRSGTSPAGCGPARLCQPTTSRLVGRARPRGDPSISGASRPVAPPLPVPRARAARARRAAS